MVNKILLLSNDHTMICPGPQNLITDVDGISVGQIHDDNLKSGVTVILPDERCVAAMDLRGGGSGNRDTYPLTMQSIVDRIDAVVLSGGSAFGLDAASGVMDWHKKHNKGFRFKNSIVPIVPTAICFDLENGGHQSWPLLQNPYIKMGYQAVDSAQKSMHLGKAGAGFGARSENIEGGIGSASYIYQSIQIGAVAVVNSFGSVFMPDQKTFWAWPFEIDQEFGGIKPWSSTTTSSNTSSSPILLDINSDLTGQNTTLIVVATNVALTKQEASMIAIMAQDGLAHAIHPVHTPFDGDTVFVLSTQKISMEDCLRQLDLPISHRMGVVLQLGRWATECVARAIARGIYFANPRG